MKLRIFLFVALVYALPCRAEILEDIWNKYLPKSSASQSSHPKLPGRILGNLPLSFTIEFHNQWKYRSMTYEIYYENSTDVAASIYNLALHARDIDISLPQEKFRQGVLGFHYSVTQVCSWLNDVFSQKTYPPLATELAFIGILLQDEVLYIHNGTFFSTGKVKHILGAGQGQRKSFAETLQHERLHVFWDEDANFRLKAYEKWNSLSDDERRNARKSLYKYNRSNESQVVEEWTIHHESSSNKQIY